MGGTDGRGKIKMASASIPSVKELATTLVHTEKLKPMIKGPSQENWYLVERSLQEKTRLKKLMIMIIIIIIMNKLQE